MAFTQFSNTRGLTNTSRASLSVILRLSHRKRRPGTSRQQNARQSLISSKIRSSYILNFSSESVFSMQVVRQCSTCARRTPFLNQSDISLLRADRKILCRGAACIDLRRYVMHSQQCWRFGLLKQVTCMCILIKLEHCKLKNTDDYHYLPVARRKSC